MIKNSYEEYKKLLKDEYLETFNKVELYIESQYADMITKERYMQDLMDLFMSAQENNKPIEKVVGNDLEAFCKSYCSDISTTNRMNNFFDNFNTTAWIALILSIFEILYGMIDGVNPIHAQMDSFLIYLMIGVALVSILEWLLSYVLMKLVVSSNTISMKTMNALKIVISLIIFIIYMIFILNRDDNVFHCNALIILLVSITYIMYQKKTKKTRFSESYIDTEDFAQSVQNDIDAEFPLEMGRKYDKKRSKLAKKNQEYTWEQYLQDEEKETNKLEKTHLFTVIIPIAIVIFAFLNTEYDTVMDKYIFLGILVAIEAIIFYFIMKAEKNIIKERRAWLVNEYEKINDLKDK